MRLFGLDIRRAPVTKAGALSPVAENRGGWRTIFDVTPGAWQRNEEWTVDTVLAHAAVYSCITLIAQDVGKLRPKLVAKSSDGIWVETEDQDLTPLLARPNRFQNHIQFKEWWLLSKLMRGNTYVFKEMRGGKVTALYLLDPSRVKVLVATDGSVFYEIGEDNLSGIRSGLPPVPASAIIHDRMNCLFHPLVGVSPIFASGMAASMGLKIQSNSKKFFSKGSNPSGTITAPTEISPATATRLAEEWNARFSGDNSGAVAVLGDNMKFEAMRMSAVDSQLIDQLKWTAETVCATFHVPPFKAGIGAAPTYPNAVEGLNQIYYSDCLQSHIESLEAVLDHGLGLDARRDGKAMGVELDLDALLRMDTGAQIKSLSDGIGGALLTPNEARRKMDLPPLPGGDTVYMQQQNYSLEALDDRDRNSPLRNSSGPAPAPAAAPPPSPEPEARKALGGLEDAAPGALAQVALRFHQQLAGTP